TVNNVAPTVGAIAVTPAPSSEGSSVSASANFTDPGTQDTFTCSISWGDTTTTAGSISGHTCSGTHTYVDNGNYTITFTVADDDLGSGTRTTSSPHTVNNAAPSVGPPVASPAAINEGDTANVTATFTDPGSTDTHTCSINWGDGTAPTAGVV